MNIYKSHKSTSLNPKHTKPCFIIICVYTADNSVSHDDDGRSWPRRRTNWRNPLARSIAIGLKNDSIYNQKQNSQLTQENLIHGQCTVA